MDLWRNEGMTVLSSGQTYMDLWRDEGMTVRSSGQTCTDLCCREMTEGSKSNFFQNLVKISFRNRDASPFCQQLNFGKISRG